MKFFRNINYFFQKNKFTGATNISSWLLHWIFSLSAAFIFYVLNRSVIVGRENIPQNKKNLIYMSNHISYAFDSFFVGMADGYPSWLLKSFDPPYHPAAYEYCHSSRWMEFVSKNLRCIPIKRAWKNDVEEERKEAKFDSKGVSTITEVLKEGRIIIFPEGTRSKDGKIGEGRPGSGRLAYETRATVIPVKISGLNKLWPKGAKFLSCGNELKIIFGKPVDLEEFYNLPESGETGRLIINRIMEKIKEL